ncbi:MAG: DUF4270 domain-containing protein [Bacteroidetes bacterium]|nr:DUF4270 domain-containing protein [Bacteroidota bacterium]
MAGRYSDGAFGTVTASSYFQLALPSSLSIDENSRYDSICLILKPTGYCYGDSTKDYTLQVHKLAEDLDNDDITFRYNVSEVSYFSEILGSKTTVFRPSSGREFTVKLSDTFGALLLSKILNEDDEFETQEKFNQYFPGLAIMPDELSQSNILQFDASDTTSKMRLYYHVGREENYLDFQITGTTLQYNRIGSDYSNSALKILTDKEDMLPSVASGNETYCQAGTGLMTRLEFPNLKKYLKLTLLIKF